MKHWLLFNWLGVIDVIYLSPVQSGNYASMTVLAQTWKYFIVLRSSCELKTTQHQKQELLLIKSFLKCFYNDAECLHFLQYLYLKPSIWWEESEISFFCHYLYGTILQLCQSLPKAPCGLKCFVIMGKMLSCWGSVSKSFSIVFEIIISLLSKV